MPAPIFPGITNFRKILAEYGDLADMFYFENLNLRGAFRFRVMRYIRDNHRELVPLYDEIYRRGNGEYWKINNGRRNRPLL
ncbi:MAG: hypothetical protein LBD31_08125 [Treponema sp.]|nr:hypothetical protein [Treponema sp.]